MNELQLQVEELKNKFLPNYYKSVDVDEGWYQIVVDCDKDLTQIDPDYQIAQIKQKFGGLRYYFQPSLSHTQKDMDDVVTKYEAVAAVTCEATGNPGVLMKSTGGWFRTLDPEYAKTTLFFKNFTVVEKKQNSFTLVGGQILTNTHDASKCWNEYCTLHNFSNHHMIDWPQNWRSDRKIIERICPHGIGHPDPDEITDDKTHGCDGCCAVPEQVDK